jgi:tellurite resistance protein TehA-like permease
MWCIVSIGNKKGSFPETLYMLKIPEDCMMSNQALLWSILILPWLTLFFMPNDSIKRWMPVALFSALTSVLAVELGENLGWFVYGVAPLSNTLIVTSAGVLAYGYQMWQEKIFARSEIKSASYSWNLQPAATKPLPEDGDNEKSE